MIELIQNWAIGVGTVLVSGLLIKKVIVPQIKNRLTPLITKYLASRLTAALAGGGIDDMAVRQWFQQVTYATVMLAEAKFPDEGMGPDKYKFVFGLITKAIPMAGPILEKHGTTLADAINDAVIQMDQTFKMLIDDNVKLIETLPWTPPKGIVRKPQ